ncbi:unnamed protein product [Brassicogethes aeneus]|uniref:Scavenger receptor class B member 1 n=1 Tax=Brassicogethes aeneus TaxID=1431903 RepID=A0A9P0ASU3_BRAAE|nr:unnamed protein product [Brassicogethes aeneus]
MIYPELDSLRRVSETFEKMPKDFKTKNQLFMKGPIAKKVLNGLNPEGQKFLGYEVNSRRMWFITGLLLLFCSSFIGTIIMFFTNIFDNAIYNNLIIANNTDTFSLWEKPPVPAIIKLYIFNYTNVDDYENRFVDKLNVEEVGPYVYEEILERVNVQFHDNDTVSYQEKRSYKFRPELSLGRKQSDQLVVPNVPLIGAANHQKESNFLARVGLSMVLGGLRQKPFLKLAAQKFIFGYESDLYSISKSVLKFQNEKVSDEFGLLSQKVGLSQDVITINTGAKDFNKIGVIEKINDDTDLHHWSTDECNSYKGTDGTTFPPKIIKDKRQVNFFIKQFCRAIPMNYEKEVTILNGKIPAYKYTIPSEVFETSDVVPENQCFCDMKTSECPKKGVMNTSPCAFGVPLYVSLPHLKGADKSLRNGVTGLNPNPTDTESYVYVHPTMGFLMSGASRFQGNLLMTKSYGVSQLDIFQEDEIMLPISWMEMGVDSKDLPDDVISLIYTTTFTIKGVQLGFKYGCLLTAIVTAVCIIIVLKSKYQMRPRTSSIRPLQRRETC